MVEEEYVIEDEALKREGASHEKLKLEKMWSCCDDRKMAVDLHVLSCNEWRWCVWWRIRWRDQGELDDKEKSGTLYTHLSPYFDMGSLVRT